MIGQTISHYKILEKLGEGGMGVVYKAEDLTLKRIVALKFFPVHVSASETDKARFLLEAQAAAALNHPNICTIYGIEDQDGHSFIAMEFVDGQTLREKGHAIPLAKAVDIGVQVADGLAAAHEKGIVHRDIKPENIMVRKDGLVQIMDFGLAKLRASRASRLTKEGSTVGTAGYMSPEQIQGQETDHRSDIFSLGVLLYELFTGELPFKGVHETALLYEIVNVDPAPMSTVKPEIDPELDRIVLECLQKEPDERYNAVKDIAKDLKRFKRESSKQRLSRTMPARPGMSAARPAQPAHDRQAPAAGSRTRELVAWAAAGLCLAAAAYVFWAFSLSRHEKPAEVVRFRYMLPAGAVISNTLAISPDGKHFAYPESKINGSRVVLRSMSDIDGHPVAGTEGVTRDVFFSPGGDWIGFDADGKLKRVSIRGGSPVTLCAVNNLRGASAADDNTIVYAPSSSSGLWKIPADGGTPAQVTWPDSAKGEISHRYPDVLPGSKAVLFTVKTNSITKFSDASIAVQRFGEREKKILIEGGSFPRYLSSGYLLYGRGGSLYAVQFDPERLELSGSPVRVLDGGMLVEGFGSMNLGVSAGGTLVYTPGGPAPMDSNSVLVYDRQGHSRLLIPERGSYSSAAISPDRERVASYRVAANDDIWLFDLRRQITTRFTFAGGNNWYPIWSPDGRHVVYTAERGSQPNLFWKTADGGGTEERLSRSDYVQVATSFTADGHTLLYHQGNASGDDDIWSMAMEGERKSQIVIHSKFNEDFAAVSPDGRWIAYESDESGKFEVYAAPFPSGDGKTQISTGGGFNPQWTKGGAELIYFTPDHNVESVPITYTPELRAGNATTLFTFPDAPLWSPDVSADGGEITAVMPGEQRRASEIVVVINWFEELRKQMLEQ